MTGLIGSNPQSTQVHGQGKKVAKTFLDASQAAKGYQPSADVAQIGLETVADQHGATPGEKLVARAVLQQAVQAEKALTQEVIRGDSQGSRYCLLTEGLGYIAAGGVANGPVGVVLADLGNRQMDSTRAQNFNTATPSNVRDSNVVGAAMLKQIAENVEDANVQQIAEEALSKLGKRYQKSEKPDRLERDREQLYKDSAHLHQTFDNIKMVAGLGDANNPKIVAMFQGELPEGGSISIGRPGGGSAEYPGAGQGFGVTRPPKPFDY